MMIRIIESSIQFGMDEVKHFRSYNGTNGLKRYAVLLESNVFVVLEAVKAGNPMLDGDAEFRVIYIKQDASGFEKVAWEAQLFILIKSKSNSTLIIADSINVSEVWSKDISTYRQEGSGSILAFKKIEDRKYNISIYSMDMQKWFEFGVGRAAFICNRSLIVEHSEFEFTVYRLTLGGRYNGSKYKIDSTGIIRSIQSNWSLLILRNTNVAEIHKPFEPTILVPNVKWVTERHNSSSRYIEVGHSGVRSSSFWLDAETGEVHITRPQE